MVERLTVEFVTSGKASFCSLVSLPRRVTR